MGLDDGEDFSTQHLMLEAGQVISWMTSSHMREAMAWIHFPGQPSAVAVLVTDPRKPGKETDEESGFQQQRSRKTIRNIVILTG